MNLAPAEFRDVPKALALLFGCEPNVESATVAQAFQMLSRGEWELNNLVVAKVNDGIVGAVFAQCLSGGTAVIWPARTRDGEPETEHALTMQALALVSTAKVVQAFLRSDELHLTTSLLRSGFRRTTQVLEMNRTANSAASQIELPQMTFVRYADSDPAAFRETLWKSHENSLDCPEMHEHRTQADLFEGYRDCARDLGRWWLVEGDSRPVGVLILSDRELTFVGVVPEHRGKGIGRALVAAACKNSPELSLIVDARNTPAIQLYQSMGFQVTGAREVFLKFQTE